MALDDVKDLEAGEELAPVGGRRIFLFSIILAFVVTGTLLLLLYRADQNRALVESTTTVRLQLKDFLACLTDAETGQRGFLITGEDKYLEPYNWARERIDKVLSTLHAASSVRTKQRDVAIDDLQRLWNTRLKVIDEVIRLNRAGEREQAVALVKTGVGKKLMDDARKRVAAISDEEEQLLKKHQSQHHRYMWFIVLTAILGYAVPISLLATATKAMRRENAERRNAEREARAQRERLWVSLRSIGDAVISTDANGRIDFLNPVAEKLTGWKIEEAAGHECTEVFRILNESTRLTVESPVSKVLREGVVVGLANHTVLIARDETEYHIDDSAAPIRDASGSLLGVILVFRDISKQRAAEAIEAERVQLMSLTADVNAALVQSSTQPEMLRRCCEGIVENLDAAFCRLWILNEADQVLEPVASAGVAAPVAEWAARVPIGKYEAGSIAQSREAYVSNFAVTDPRLTDKEWLARESLVAFAGYPLIVDEALVGVMALFSRQAISPSALAALDSVADVVALGIVRRTAQESLKVRNAELASARDKALDASRAKSAFLASTSHELRTPLNAIIGYAEMVQEELNEGARETLQVDIQRIEAAGRHLLALINDILDLSKIEAGRMELLVEPFQVAAIVEEVRQMVLPMVAKSQNTLIVDCDHACGEMVGDPTKVRQILFNLLSNALKFTENGEVSLTVLRESIGEEGWISFAIDDSGIGMTTEQIATLFRDFSQLDSTSTRKYGGTGLGLAISRRFSRMLGGDISVKSEVGKGSTFTARLPVIVQGMPTTNAWPEDVVPPTQLQYEGPEAECTLLVIDDDPTVHDLIRRTVQKEGVRVASAFNGATGLEMARQVKPQAITLDVVMPDLDGWTVLGALKSDSEVSDIPVVLLSIVDDRNLGFTLGATEYLTKPIQRDLLLNVLHRAGCKSPKCNVLVVDDDEDALRLAVRFLEGQGFDVCTAGDGAEALEKLEGFAADVILLDLMMPVMDGFHFLEKRDADDRLRSIPVVVLTAKELDSNDRARLRDAVDRVLQKGLYTKEELLALVRKHARKKPIQNPG